MHWLQDPNQSNSDNLNNARHEASKKALVIANKEIGLEENAEKPKHMVMS